MNKSNKYTVRSFLRKSYYLFERHLKWFEKSLCHIGKKSYYKDDYLYIEVYTS